jgi:signal transduction histidine kinase/ligand-binding sensor domain-containing protein
MSQTFRALLTCLLATVSVSFAQTPALPEPGTNVARLLIQSWRTAEGLPQNTVQAIAQMPDGYLWVGTKGGLARFDGVRFTTFGLADGLKGLDVADLLEDGQGGLWIGTSGGGLSRWRDGAISTLTAADGMADNNALQLASAGPGAVWVGGSVGLQHYGTNGFTRVGAAEGLPADDVRALAADHAGGLWVALANEGLFLLQNGRCERMQGPGQLRLVSNALLVDDEGALWVSIGNGRVLRRHAGAWTEFNPSHGLPMSFISCLAQGEPGEIWAGSHAEGFYVFREGRFHAVTTLPWQMERNIRSVLRGRDGLIWVGTLSGGLSRLAPRRVQAAAVGRMDQRAQVNSLAEAPDGRFWVTTYGRGLYHGDLESWRRLQGAITVDEGPFLLSALRSRSGVMYFGGSRGLHWFEPGATNLVAAKLDDTIVALCETPDDTLWIGTREGRLLRLDGNQLVAATNGNFLARISGLTSEPGGALWIATRGQGLFHWQAGVRRQWTAAQGLPTDVLRALHFDADGTLWIGTVGGGLAWLQGGKLHVAQSRHGLSDDVVSQILEDDDGNLWLGGNRGIFRVAKRELRDLAAGRVEQVHPLALSETDGMPEAECTGGYAPAGLRTQSGLLCFSTVHGVVAVDPKKFGLVDAPPRVLIEQIRLDDRRIAARNQEVALPPGPRELEIRYTAFNYAKPERIRFRHRMEGLDAQWTLAAGERSARFPLLPPGRYRFEVSAANEDGRWSEVPAGLAFTVQPFYWQTGWFRLFVAVLLMAIGALVVWRVAYVRIRRAELRERVARAETEAQQRRNEVAHLTRVATLGELSSALAHEINQPLGAILRNTEAAEIFLQSDAPDLGELRAILADIRQDDQRAGAVIDRMRALLRRSEPEVRPLDVAEVLRDVATLVRGDAEARQVKLAVEVPDGLPPVSADRVQLQQVLLNLILNGMDALDGAVGERRRVTVCARLDGAATVEFAVRDCGPGVPAAQLARVFEPFFTTKPKGVGMGLAISTTIIKAHGGELWAENHEGGAIFRFTLPKAQKDPSE